MLYNQNINKIIVSDQKNLTLTGLTQFTKELKEEDKNKCLITYLKKIPYNQVIIFVKSVRKAKLLNKLLLTLEMNSLTLHSKMQQKERIEIYEKFKKFESRILVATNLIARGIDIERVNLVINYDMPECAETYLHRVGRAGRYKTKGIALTFVELENEVEKQTLDEIKEKFVIKVPEIGETVNESLLLNN